MGRLLRKAEDVAEGEEEGRPGSISGIRDAGVGVDGRVGRQEWLVGSKEVCDDDESGILVIDAYLGGLLITLKPRKG